MSGLEPLGALPPLPLPALPLPEACARMNSTDCTNMPDEAAAGIVDPGPAVGLEHLSTSSLTTQRGV